MSGVVQLPPDSTGKKVDTRELTVGANTVERQVMVIADPTVAAGLVDCELKGVQGTYALTTQDFKDSGRTVMALVSNNVASVASEAMMSTTGTVLYRGGATVSGSSGSYTVTAGKTFRVGAINVFLTAGGATATAVRVFLRSIFSASQTITTSSAVAMVPVSVAASGFGGATLPLSDGIEFAAGTTFGLSHVQSTTATSNLVTVVVTGYEY